VTLPLPPATRIGVNTEVGCAAVDDGVLCWGRNTNAQLESFETALWIETFGARPMAVPPGPPVRNIFVGAAAFVLRDDGTAVSWGANPPLARVSPLFPDPNPFPISLTDISSMDLVGNSACATVGGIGYCWGDVAPDSPAWGNPNAPHIARALPEPVVAPEPVVQIATTRNVITTAFGERIVAPQRWCAVGASGAVYCWGYNESGQAGDGTKSFAFEAVAVQALPAPAVQVKTTLNSTCALLTTGKVYCWGTNFYGQLGNGTLKLPSLVPVEVVLP
jgi:Regulator of chromosome condensation (RCC1) repeat